MRNTSWWEAGPRRTNRQPGCSNTANVSYLPSWNRTSMSCANLEIFYNVHDRAHLPQVSSLPTQIADSVCSGCDAVGCPRSSRMQHVRYRDCKMLVHWRATASGERMKDGRHAVACAIMQLTGESRWLPLDESAGGSNCPRTWRTPRSTDHRHGARAVRVTFRHLDRALQPVIPRCAPHLSNYALGSFPPSIDCGPPCGAGVGMIHGPDCGEGREGQCRRRLTLRFGGGQCADVEDHDAGTAAGGATGSTLSGNKYRTGLCPRGRGDSHSEAGHGQQRDTALPAYIHTMPTGIVHVVVPNKLLRRRMGRCPHPQSCPCRAHETQSSSSCEADIASYLVPSTIRYRRRSATCVCAASSASTHVCSLRAHTAYSFHPRLS
ncbi:hypothetical protein OH76DRAFT_555209 [Lentinus brumalis]|uniref:Uncharacterized protein n=1 Tax=Lentinus brumalis TaxID=2498619 RepID=A0A371D999_9APHY|nr:hypothetical protein OH76DRAFT_555209 [Polyporus brumalis]